MTFSFLKKSCSALKQGVKGKNWDEEMQLGKEEEAASFQQAPCFSIMGDRPTVLLFLKHPVRTMLSLDPSNKHNHFPLPGTKHIDPAVYSPRAGHSDPEELCLTRNANSHKNLFITTSTALSSLAVRA